MIKSIRPLSASSGSFSSRVNSEISKTKRWIVQSVNLSSMLIPIMVLSIILPVSVSLYLTTTEFNNNEVNAKINDILHYSKNMIDIIIVKMKTIENNAGTLLHSLLNVHKEENNYSLMINRTGKEIISIMRTNEYIVHLGIMDANAAIECFVPSWMGVIIIEMRLL